MKMVKVTVAIPIYNAARHLKVTLDSLFHQSMRSNDFEVICVNDCSTDGSAEVIQSFQEKMPNLLLINRTENSGGPMIPRNQAIEQAKGQYILFLDNDDFIGEETLERLYKKAVKNKSDVIFGRYVGVNGRQVPRSMFQKGNLLKADLVKNKLVNGLAPHKMYRLGLLRENDIRFEPEAKVGEDQLFTMQCYIKAKTLTVLNDYDYYFVVKRGHENLSLKYFPAEQFFFAFNRIMDYIEEHVDSELYKKQLKTAYLNRFFRASRLRKYLLTNAVLNKEQKKLWLQETKKFIENHVLDLIETLEPKHQVFVRLAWENSLETLLALHSKIVQVTAENFSRIQDGLIYGRFRGEQNNKPYDVEAVINSWNTTELFLSDFSCDESSLRIAGQFSQSLLVNQDVTYQVILVHQPSGTELSFNSQPTNLKDGFRFEFEYRDHLIHEELAGPWDLFVEAQVGSFKNRCRLGAKRALNVNFGQPVSGLEPSGKTYTIKPYWATPDHLSLEVTYA
jgi:glycosyltransferase involved in cell wall biosynthesis